MTIQIEAGKYYRTRDGRKVGPMQKSTHGDFGGFWSEHVGLYRSDGSFGYGSVTSRRFDLIAEWRDDTPAHIITHEGREYDLTKLETPFGLLPEPVQKTLKAWPCGSEQYTSCGWLNHAMHKVSYHPCVVYRAKPAPVEVRVSCYRGVAGVGGKYGTCIKRADGTIDWTTWEAQE